MIHVENLTKIFGSIKAVDNVTFDIKRGQVFSFLGPNGAGKTTTIRMLATLIRPTSGTITIDERNSLQNPEHIRSILGLLTETPGMYEKISAYENLEFFSSFYDRDKKAIKANIEKYLKMFDLWDRRNYPVKTYSKGMKQKLALARALVHEPKILFLDEPTAGLDPESAFMVRQFIETLQKDASTTVFLCTHNLEEAQNLSDIVCIIKNRIITISTLDELQKNSGKNTEIIFKNNPEKYKAIFEQFSEKQSIEISGKRVVLNILDPQKTNPEMIKRLSDAGAEIIYFNSLKASLEQIYLDMIKN